MGCLSTRGSNLLELTQSFFKIFWLLKMYRAFAPGTFFFAVFSKNLAKKFIFGAIFVVVYLPHLMHSVGAICIMSHSEYAPDLLGARGVANPGASFFDRKGIFSRRNAPGCPHEVREIPS